MLPASTSERIASRATWAEARRTSFSSISVKSQRHVSKNVFDKATHEVDGATVGMFRRSERFEKSVTAVSPHIGVAGVVSAGER